MKCDSLSLPLQVNGLIGDGWLPAARVQVAQA